MTNNDELVISAFQTFLNLTFAPFILYKAVTGEEIDVVAIATTTPEEAFIDNAEAVGEWFEEQYGAAGVALRRLYGKVATKKNGAIVLVSVSSVIGGYEAMKEAGKVV